MDNKITKANESALSELHGMTTAFMKRRLLAALSGEIEMAAAELSAITKFLKDNGIECTRADMEEQLKAVIHLDIPTFDNEEDVEALI